MPEMSNLRFTRRFVAACTAALALSVSTAIAQTPNAGNLPANPRGGNGVTNEQLQKLAWIRYLQGRSGGGGGSVKRGVPQFIPFGGGMPFGNMMNQGAMNQGALPQMQGQGGAAGAADPDAGSGKKTAEEKKAEYAAAREEKKRKAKERAEKRKAELAERRAKAAAGN